MLLFSKNASEILFLFTICLIPLTDSSLQGEEVSRWAEAIGNELWTLGRAITRFEELQKKYVFHNAKVEKSNPEDLLDEIKTKIEIMVDRKVSAIEAIQEKAEAVAEAHENTTANITFYSSRYSHVYNMPDAKYTHYAKEYANMFRNMSLSYDSHFYNLSVNTNHSSVYVPVNIYDRNVTAVLEWSELLDEVFIKNYNEDPALSWQYFGSATGIMRHYPAQRWAEDTKKELLIFDCRVRTWYIEAATCTKDIIILIDNSGSMQGLNKNIAASTAIKIMDTFSNNDYVNILNYTDKTDYLIPCFENTLVQATKENINIFKNALDILSPEGKTQLEQALLKAFELLEGARAEKECDQANGTCNQAIMVITDGVNSNLTDFIRKYNHLDNGTNIPVRIFTYLIGGEVTNIEEMQSISCDNRGYYSHIPNLEQVTASVLKYINVIARPLVLQGEQHPVSWTHAYVDLTYNDKTDSLINEPYRLLSSVAIPCYDTKINKMNDTRTAYLLGVAATDVPIDEFERLTYPYKIGVTGYAFIVSNNGYVLMHPDLRPMLLSDDQQGVLKPNYNSIDITQVEQHFSSDEEEVGARVIVDSLNELREALVNNESGSLYDIKVKYHYDNMTRVFESFYDYYFTRINNTPFTLGLAIPQKHGNYTLRVDDVIQKNKFTGQNLVSFFKGKWRIHPKWVYCKYHYIGHITFNSPQEELLHFLEKMYDTDFVWKSQYEEEKKKLHVTDYYCNRDLVLKLIFDAQNTNAIFGEKWEFDTKTKFEEYKVSVRFVATMSGLTRWNYISDPPEDAGTKEFGDYHSRAIHETWYKSAVLQHQYDASFVYAVDDKTDDNDTLITASYAIFPSDGGHEAPGSVVGFQFSQSALQTSILDISKRKSTQHCLQSSNCGTCNDILDCYVIDSSGYIVISEDLKHTSRFFGEIEEDVMSSMLAEGIFKNITIYDYQAFCPKPVKGSDSSASLILTPFKYVELTVKWILWKIFELIFEMSFHNIYQGFTYAQNSEDYDANTTMTETQPGFEDEEEEPEPVEFEDLASNYFACENSITLYLLQQDKFIKGNFHGEITTHERNYYIKRIPFSNLYFVAINNTREKPAGMMFSTAPQTYTSLPVFTIDEMNSTLLPCQKLELNQLSRRRLTGCFNHHELEDEIVDCTGIGISIKENLLLLFVFVVITIWH